MTRPTEADILQHIAKYGLEDSPAQAVIAEWDCELTRRLLEKLSSEDAAFVVHLLKDENYCSRCGEKGPYCCWDPDDYPDERD